nr:MAG TPA: Prokaryotic membrane lipoprotein lipid attachment site [Crassvirales sp.]
MKKLVFIMLAILMLSACKTTTKIVEVPIEVVKKEYIHDTKIDSVYIRDSVDRWQKGDTLYITKWHTKFKYINKVDTIVKIDSIPKIVPVVKEVEVNHIYWWQKTLMWVGGILLIYIIISLIHKFKK